MAVAKSKHTDRNVDDKQKQDSLSSVVKGVHSQLRAQLAEGISKEIVWSSHLSDTAKLRHYAAAMCSLATGPWMKHGLGRIQWCVDACKEYFLQGTLEKLLKKDLRRLAHGNPTQLEIGLLPQREEDIEKIVNSFQYRQLSLLDVGSCYNPFEIYEEFCVTAIDIAPATKSVFQCDFLQVPIILKSEIEIVPQNSYDSDNSIVLQTLTKESFDVVVFSLLLSYFPSTEQRMQCCINAHKVLCHHGILLVITADSSHQNRHVDMMKSWTLAIESIGFHRWKYFKDTHLHCMAFRKTRTILDYLSIKSKLHANLYIPQDTQAYSSKDARTIAEDSINSDDAVLGFNELPFDS